MINNEDDLVAFHIGTRQKSSCFLNIFFLFLIPFLILLGAIAAFTGFIPLKMEIHSVIMIAIIFIIYLYFMKHNAYYAACKFKKTQKKMGHALKKYIDNNILTIGDVSKANAPFDTFIKEYSTPLRNDNFSSVAASIFPTLGILGTFISIALTMPDFSSQDSALLEKEISLLLGGVGTAFYISIYGIFLSLWWIFFEKKGMSNFERSVYSIRKNTKHYFWTKEEIEQVHFTESMKNFENLNAIFNKIASNEFIDNIQNTLQQRVYLFDSIIHHEQNAFQKVSDHFNNVLQISEHSIRESEKVLNSHKDIVANIEEFTNQIATSNKLLRSLNQSLLHKEDNIQEVTGRLDRNISQLNKSLAYINADNVKELYGAVMQNIEIMRSETSKIGYAFNKHLNDFDDQYTDKLRSSLELIDSESAKIIAQIAKLHDIDKR